MSAKPEYRRLPGRSGLFVRNSLWIAADHVLRVRGNPFSESYRRYYFADIQAIGCTELPGAIPSYGYTICALLLAVAAALVYTSHPIWAALCAAPTLTGFYFSWQWPTSVCYVKTSISSEKLPSLRHRGNAEKTVTILKAEIEKVQGVASAELLLSEVPAPRATTAPAAANPEIRHSRGITHWILFADMLASGALSAAEQSLRPIPRVVSIASGILGIAMLLLIIIAAVQQRRSDLAIGVRRMVYGALGWYVANVVSSIGLGLFLVIRLKPAVPVQLTNHPVMKAYELVNATAYIALGCAGLILLWRQHTSLSAPPALAPGNRE